MQLRIGNGYDIHRLVSGRALILGGQRLEHPSGLGLDGHSDADVLVHAIMDALIRIERPDEVLSLAASRDDQHSSSPETRLRFAKALLAMNAADQAEQELRAIVEEQPEWIPGLDALCDALRLQKKIKEALALFRRIETLDPDQAVLRNLRYRMFGTSE